MRRRAEKNNNYHSYMVRLWREGSGGTWHATAQRSADASVHNFATVAALFTFLLTEMDGQLPAGLTNIESLTSMIAQDMPQE